VTVTVLSSSHPKSEVKAFLSLKGDRYAGQPTPPPVRHSQSVQYLARLIIGCQKGERAEAYWAKTTIGCQEKDIAGAYLFNCEQPMNIHHVHARDLATRLAIKSVRSALASI
jgi:hypothetical protein